MPGGSYNTIIATPCHWYSPEQVCHAGITTAVDDELVATVRLLDSPGPDPQDITGAPLDSDLVATDTWHYPSSCTNLTPSPQ